ncbi:MAG: flagellar basal body L-ring protein FlgH [Myxococcales bacterium]|nr:flagellar basal body L-ring protein FlgH [Myxococcales bacterium]
MSISDRWGLAVSIGLSCGLALGCVERAIPEMIRGHDYAPLPEPAEPLPEEGAIWRGKTASGSFLFYDSKAHGVGDLVTVLVIENVSAEGSAATSLSKASNMGGALSSDIGLTGIVEKGAEVLLDVLGLDSGNESVPGAEINPVSSSSTNDYDGDGTTSREGSFQAIVTCRVVAELPGDVFHVRGKRTIVVNHELQVLTVEGLVRKEDIGINNTVPSTALAEAQLVYDGVGVIDDKQRPPVMSRVMQWIYPF